MTTTPVSTEDIAELLISISMVRAEDLYLDIEAVHRPWRGAATLRWVDYWKDTNGYWRRGHGDQGWRRGHGYQEWEI